MMRADVREAAGRDRREDHFERRAVEHQHADARVGCGRFAPIDGGRRPRRQRRLPAGPAGHDRRRHREHHRERQDRGADAPAAAAEMREPEAEKEDRGGGDQRGADKHAIARDRIEHVAKAAPG